MPVRGTIEASIILIMAIPAIMDAIVIAAEAIGATDAGSRSALAQPLPPALQVPTIEVATGATDIATATRIRCGTDGPWFSKEARVLYCASFKDKRG